MQPGTKKIVVVTTVSFGILMFSFLIPAVIIPTYMQITEAGSCTDYGCAQDMFTRCNSVMAGSDDFVGTWTKGMEGMFCMMGVGGSAKATTLYIFN